MYRRHPHHKAMGYLLWTFFILPIWRVVVGVVMGVVVVVVVKKRAFVKPLGWFLIINGFANFIFGFAALKYDVIRSLVHFLFIVMDQMFILTCAELSKQIIYYIYGFRI